YPVEKNVAASAALKSSVNGSENAPPELEPLEEDELEELLLELEELLLEDVLLLDDELLLEPDDELYCSFRQDTRPCARIASRLTASGELNGASPYFPAVALI